MSEKVAVHVAEDALRDVDALVHRSELHRIRKVRIEDLGVLNSWRTKLQLSERHFNEWIDELVRDALNISPSLCCYLLIKVHLACHHIIFC